MHSQQSSDYSRGILCAFVLNSCSTVQIQEQKSKSSASPLPKLLYIVLSASRKSSQGGRTDMKM